MIQRVRFHHGLPLSHGPPGNNRIGNFRTLSRLGRALDRATLRRIDINRPGLTMGSNLGHRLGPARRWGTCRAGTGLSLVRN